MGQEVGWVLGALHAVNLDVVELHHFLRPQLFDGQVLDLARPVPQQHTLACARVRVQREVGLHLLGLPDEVAQTDELAEALDSGIELSLGA